MKVGIIGGAGLLGSTTAFRLATQKIVDEIVLIDLNENLLKSHVMDMEQAISEISQVNIIAGSWGNLRNCNVVLMSASIPERNVKSRVDFLVANLEIVRSVCGYIKEYCPNAAIINATNPVDVNNLVIHKLTGVKHSQIIGFSRNDTLRLRWSIARVLGLKTTDIDAVCIGEHGEKQVPLFSRVFVKGEPYELTSDQKSRVLLETSSWFTKMQALNSGRTTGWTSSLGLEKIVRCIVNDLDEIIPCSAILQGEYGLNDVSLGVPVQLGPNGIKKIVVYPINEEESSGLFEAANKIKQLEAQYVQYE